MLRKKYYPIYFSVIAVFIIRIIFSFLPSFGFDMGSWLGWARRLSEVGFAGFYSDQSWTQYTPGFMYYLWVIGKLGWVSEWAVKIPVTLADIGVGVLIWNLVKKVNPKFALASFFLYTLNPVTVFDGPVWGQIDGLLTLLLFASAYFLIEKKSFPWAVFFWALGFLVKPQSIAIAPAFLLAVFLRKFKLKEILYGVLVGVATIIFLSWPFFVSDPILGLPQQIIKMGNFYSYTSVFAFNIWSWTGFWKPDTALFLGLSLSGWGAIFLVSSILLALFTFRKKLDSKANYFLLFAILSLCFFVFPTKVHERYLFPFFAFLLAAAGLAKSRNLTAIYIVTSLASFLNLYYPYSYYYPAQLKSDFLYSLSGSLAKVIGFVFLGAYFLLLKWEKLPRFTFPKLSFKKAEVGDLPKVKLPKNRAKMALVAILVFAFITRVFSLGSPPEEYFDEVYHAFTAKVMLSGEKNKAWEWWNTPPEGFAYEWTHPPLAKLGMALGMSIFGQNSFGYRIPGAILGVGSVFLVYLLAKKLFGDETVGLVSAAVFSLDGLTLVMNRIGMNDSYLLFFSLLSIYYFLDEKDFASALSFGFALSSKWSAVWVVPILALIWLKQKTKFRLSVFWFFVLPPVVYLLTYTQMFLTGHDLKTWWEMQKQMWWYHTGLRATHPYTSPWWSWPFLARPIYLYTSEEAGGLVSKIYALGNPLVFWSGLAAVVISFVYAFAERNKKLGLVLFSYLVFFIPWAASPRIMFLYHYLPSISFMAIASGYVLRRNVKLIPAYLAICLLVFLYFYPHWAGLNVPLWLDNSYYWLPGWR